MLTNIYNPLSSFVGHKKKRGSALISALFIMTLVAIAATAMSRRLQMDIYRTQLTSNSDKLYLASQEVTFWAMDKLKNQKKLFTISDVDGRLSKFPKVLKNSYPGINITGELYDLQSRFNLNNLQNKIYHQFFLQLLKNASKETKATEQQLIFNATKDWVSNYRPGRSKNIFSDFYLKQKPPYHTSHQQIENISEFRLIYGVNQTNYQRLFPYLTVLPSPTPINLNTAPKILLQSLGNGLKPPQLAELLEARGQEGFVNLRKITPLLRKLDIPGQQITIESEYFLAVATVSSQEMTLTNYVVLKRNRDKKRNISVSILRESLNTI